jgi:glucose-1-phosphate cytidylyltransferase
MKQQRRLRNMPPAMILCGGMGTRLRDVTESLPKPMVPIGPQPIIWHIMKSFAAHGVRRFILCLGYKRECFIDFFLNYTARATDLTIKLGQRGNVIYHGGHHEDNWEVTLVDTGLKTMTGGRVARATKYLRPTDQDFFLTYGDGLSDIDISALLSLHRQQRRAITISAVHPVGRFGELTIQGNTVTGFVEKPPMESGLINGGFMVLKKQFAARYLDTDASLVLEKSPMMLAAKNQDMAAYVHRGFWQCMDTLREHQLLNELWESGHAPWAATW